MRHGRHRSVRASTRPASTTTSSTCPPRPFTRRQVAPPSVVCHSAGPNAHPRLPLVNRIVATAPAGGLLWYISAGGALGAETGNQLRPPSAVSRTTTVRQVGGWSAHGVASSQPRDAVTKLTDRTVSGATTGRLAPRTECAVAGWPQAATSRTTSASTLTCRPRVPITSGPLRHPSVAKTSRATERLRLGLRLGVSGPRLLHHFGVDGHGALRQRRQQLPKLYQIVQVRGGIPVVKVVLCFPRRVN